MRQFGALENLLLWVTATLGAILLFLLRKSCRLKIVLGEEALRKLQQDPHPVLIASWHNQSILAAYFVLQHLHPKGLPVGILASHSKDGEIAARVGKILGFSVIRGSSARGGALALRHLHRAVIDAGLSPALVPDGPRGPIYRCKPGIIALAQLSGAPILRVAGASNRAWRLGSWDRLIIPQPFSTIQVGLETPKEIPRELSDEGFRSECTELDMDLNNLTRRVREMPGKRDR